MSVSRANRLVCNRGRGSWDGATFTAAAKRAATTRWSSCLARPSPQPAAKREGQEEPSKLHREGDSEWLVAGVGGLRTPVVGRLDRSPPSPQLLEQVDGGATKAPVWPPSPLLSWVPVPSPPSSLLSPLLSTSLLQFCLFGTGVGGVGVLSSWDSRALIKESWRTVRPSPESSCLSRFIKSTTQGVSRDAGFVVIFHVINKDSFV